MKFISFADRLEKVIETVVNSSELHSKWLNTLSFLENCGARKIAACEHPIFVKEEMLKHAAEEFRHALHLKRQIIKVFPQTLDSYCLNSLLGGTATWHYITALDLITSRYLKSMNLTPQDFKKAAYLLVTYAIEMRAAELYPIYEMMLRKVNSRISVKSIYLEEKEHLNEIKAGLEDIPSGILHANHISAFESQICKRWLDQIETKGELL